MKSFGFEAVLYPWLPNEQIVEIMIVVFFTAIFSSIFPAWKALVLKPAEAISR
jgi:putative ABC transport system permease protein